MAERTSYAPGTFCWVDLSTADGAGSRRFYAGLLGWTYDERPVGDGLTYALALIDGQVVAAIAPSQPGDERTRWNNYVSVEDVDVVATRAGELGATVVVEPMDVFDAGRMAVIVDPLQAELRLWKGKDRIGASLVNEVGCLTWNDLVTTDVDASVSFYTQLFDWSIEPTPGADGQYWTIRNGERLNGGVVPAADDMPATWNAYFAVDDVDASLDQAAALGADVLLGPIDVPNGTRFVVLRDPQGAVVCLGAGPREP